MTESSIRTGKIIVACSWLLFGLGFAFPDARFAGWAQLAFLAMLAIHVVEAAVFFGLLRASGQPLPGQLAQTLVFGFLHVATLRNAALEEGTPG